LSNDKLARWYSLPTRSALPAQYHQLCSRHAPAKLLSLCEELAFLCVIVQCRMSRHTDLRSVYLDLVELYSEQHPSRAVYYLDLDGVEDDQHVLVEDFKMC
jgi:hypothetical protein